MIGQTLSHYRIVASLGAGGMGEVFRATDTKLGRDIALKVLPADVASSPERLERFRREARSLAALDHPNIVMVHSVEEADGVQFLTMQLVEGDTLSRRIPDGGMAVEQIYDVATALAGALGVAHEKGIIHRDLKPANVMLTREGTVKVLDFGLAKMTGVEGAAPGSDLPTEVHTRAGVVLGTVPYMSPEQVSGLTVDYRSDLFSLGILLYEMATGSRPFAGRSSAELSSAILRDTPPDVCQVRDGFPEQLDRIIFRCLEKEPSARFQDARDLGRALADAQSSGIEPVVPARSPSDGSAARSRGRTAAVASAALLAVAAGYFLVLQLGGPSDPLAEIGDNPAPSPLLETPSIAVLAFDNLSGDSEQDYFGDGMAAEILNALASVPDLRVAARSSALSFKGRDVDVRTIGEQLNVAHVVEGSIRISGSRLRIAAQLVNAVDGYQLWSQSFDREMTDIFTIQEEIAQAIVGQLRAHLGIGMAVPTETSLVQPGTENLEAYNAFLRGWYQLGTYSLEATRDSIQAFEAAIAADPDFAGAYGALAMAWANLHVWVPFDEVAAPMKEAFDRALELDPDQSGALAAKAAHTLRTSWDWRTAEELYLRAIEGESQDAFALDFYAAVQLCSTGRIDEAKAAYLEALEADPLNTILGWDLAWILMVGGRAEEAMAANESVLAATPEYPWGLAMRAWALTEAGTEEQLRESLGQVPDSDDELVLMMRIIAHQTLGEKEIVADLMERLRSVESSNPGAAVFLSWALIGTGQVEEGLSVLERAIDEGVFQVVFSRPYFLSDPEIREHPRFLRALERMRLDDESLREQGFLAVE